MAATPEKAFHCEVEERDVDGEQKVTMVKCHGRLVSADVEEFKKTVKPLIVRGSHILMDFADLSYMDSSGLGAVVGLKVSSMSKGECTLDLANLSPRVKELLSLANLMQLFTVKSYPGAGSAFAYHAEVLPGHKADGQTKK